MPRVAAFVVSIGLILVSITAADASSKAIPPPGSLWFGTSFVRTNGNLAIQGRKDVFHAKGTMAWVAHFKSQAGTRTLGLVISTKKGGKTVKVHKTLPVHVTDLRATEFANGKGPSHAAFKVNNFIILGAKVPGTYTLSYVRGSKTLASGAFKIVH